MKSGVEFASEGIMSVRSKVLLSGAWSHVPVIASLWGMRQEDYKFDSSL